jgi:xylulokinase
VITLGIDLGTSGVKALLLEDDHPLAVASAPLEVRQPAPGWSEQDPVQWW